MTITESEHSWTCKTTTLNAKSKSRRDILTLMKASCLNSVWGGSETNLSCQTLKSLTISRKYCSGIPIRICILIEERWMCRLRISSKKAPPKWEQSHTVEKTQQSACLPKSKTESTRALCKSQQNKLRESPRVLWKYRRLCLIKGGPMLITRQFLLVIQILGRHIWSRFIIIIMRANKVFILALVENLQKIHHGKERIQILKIMRMNKQINQYLHRLSLILN